ncbi:hypothetical protein CHCC14820_4305 [Bacillus paralicheniformis]|uniref:Uncharacterized protein n=1 Tax=Bacillus paralicheniformis TaxID=1648923 RepID=A0A6I7TKZ4_9BACI|nr:hypothetical protein SC10_B2orf01936 [Bacillus paralicheniformis]OLF94300.1 hypothetical protein B4121_1927 [Bacillus paralicheniformis]OLG06617.1 hypothetical protein B4125_0798 [Bacillus paralicheniformis]OLG12624.1 hypothetical protein B4123_0913 [Bacillus paralicheniformis]TWJ44222.1 hypothetical protein CHCC5027_0595 [Bacillus paralicheniformis]
MPEIILRSIGSTERRAEESISPPDAALSLSVFNQLQAPYCTFRFGLRFT